MLNKRVLAAAIVSASLIAPAVSPAAHAQNVANKEESVVEQGGLFKVELSVNPVHAGDKKITGTVKMAKDQTEQRINAVYPNVQSGFTVVTKTQVQFPEEVVFEITVQDTVTLNAGDSVTIASVPDKNSVGQGVEYDLVKVSVQPAKPADEQPPAPQPLPKPNPEPNTPAPGGDNSKPGADQKPENGQQDSKPESGQKPEGGLPKPEDERPKPEGDQQESKPQGGHKPEGENPGADKKPEAPKDPEKNPKDPKLPGDNGKKPEVDKDMLQGSSTIGDLFKILAALGGTAGLISGLVKLLTQGSSNANFMQSIRDFFAQFNIKF